MIYLTSCAHLVPQTHQLLTLQIIPVLCLEFHNYMIISQCSSGSCHALVQFPFVLGTGKVLTGYFVWSQDHFLWIHLLFPTCLQLVCVFLGDRAPKTK